MNLYGISNCDTVRKSRRWLSNNGIRYTFHDFHREGINTDRLHAWIARVGWEVLINRRSTTWRQLPDSIKNKTNNAQAAMILMQENPNVIKRPLLEANDTLQVGFDEIAYQALLKQA